MDPTITDLPAKEREVALSAINSVLRELLESHKVKQDVQIAIGRSPCKDLDVFIEFFNAKDDVRMDAPRLFKYAGLTKPEVRDVSTQLVLVWVDAKKAAIAAKKAAAAAKKAAAKKVAVVKQTPIAEQMPPPVPTPQQAPPPFVSVDGDAAPTVSSATASVNEPENDAADEVVEPAETALKLPPAAGAGVRSGNTLAQAFKRRGSLKMERGVLVRVRGSAQPRLNGVDGICLCQKGDLWQVHFDGVQGESQVSLPREQLEIQAKSSCSCCGPSLKRLRALQKENCELRKRARGLEPDRESVIRGIARLECAPLQQAKPDARKEWKKKLMLKWHPDKAPTPVHGVLAKEVMQEMQSLEVWQD